MTDVFPMKTSSACVCKYWVWGGSGGNVSAISRVELRATKSTYPFLSCLLKSVYSEWGEEIHGSCICKGSQHTLYELQRLQAAAKWLNVKLSFRAVPPLGFLNKAQGLGRERRAHWLSGWRKRSQGVRKPRRRRRQRWARMRVEGGAWL